MDPEHIKRLRDDNEHESPGLPLVLYLDLPASNVEEWQTQYCNVMALNRRLSQLIVELLDTCAVGEGEGDGLQDEAARALSLLAGMGPDRQAFLAPMLETVSQMEGDAFKDLNDKATEGERLMREARRRIADAQNAPSAAQEGAQPLVPTNPLPTVDEVIAACESILYENGDQR